MDLDKVLADLHEQLRNLDSAIESLGRLQHKGSRRRNHSSDESSPGKLTRKRIEAVATKKRA